MNLTVEIKGAGFPVLCLHGHPGSSKSMFVFTHHLSRRFQTIAPDLRGYGKSSASEKFQMSDHLDDLDSLLTRLKIKKCLLLGWSLGGILALELVLRHPTRFSGLILIASAARPRSNHPPVNRKDLFYTGVAGLINCLKPGWEWNIEVFGKRSLFRYLFYQQTPLAYHHLANEGVPAFLKTSAKAQQALTLAIRNSYDRLDRLETIKQPCLALAGAQDRHITAQASLETAKLLPDCCWYCYPDTAHLFPWEISKEVLADIDRWLASRPDATAAT